MRQTPPRLVWTRALFASHDPLIVSATSIPLFSCLTAQDLVAHLLPHLLLVHLVTWQPVSA